MTPDQPQAKKPRSNRMYILWSIALTLLLTLGAFCWAVVVPVWQVRRAVRPLEVMGPTWLLDGSVGYGTARWNSNTDPVEFLGGQVLAAHRLRVYLKAPSFIASKRKEAAHLLSKCGPHGIHTLLDLANDPDPEVRWVVARGLSQVDPEAVQPLILMLRDPNKDVRIVAASALGFSRTPQAIAALEEATKDDEDVVSLVARMALKKIKAAQEKKQ